MVSTCVHSFLRTCRDPEDPMVQNKGQWNKCRECRQIRQNYINDRI